MYVDVVLEFKGKKDFYQSITSLTEDMCYVDNKEEKLKYVAEFLAELIRRGKDATYDLVKDFADR